MVSRAVSRMLLAGGLSLLSLESPAADGNQRFQTPEFDSRAWTVENGLPDDSVTSIQQTAEGFLWVGTSRGLTRFDGWDFVPITIVPDAASARRPQEGASSTSLRVTAQCVDSSNVLWIATERDGLFRLDPRHADGLRAEPVGLSGEKILCLGGDTSAGVWIGTETGLLKSDSGGIQRVVTGSGGDDAAVLALQVTRSNGVWVTTRSGLKRYQDGAMHDVDFAQGVGGQKTPVLGVFEDRRGSLWVFGDTYLLNVSEGRRFNYFRGGGATLLQVWTICEGRAGQLWIGTTGQGLFHFSGGRFRAVDMREGRGYSEVRSVFLDREGQLWVGTQRGLVQLRERTVRWFTQQGAATCLTEDPEGRVWAGFEHGGLAFGKGGLLEPTPGLLPLSSQNLITSVFARGDGSLCVGTMGNGLFRIRDSRALQHTTAHGLSDNTVLALGAGGFGRLWIATGDGRLHRYGEYLTNSLGKENGLTGSPVTAIATTRDGFWIGTEQGRVQRFRSGAFQTLAPAQGFAGKAITALHQDRNSRLWAGSRGAGLACFTGETSQVWTADNGLPDNTILGIEQSASGDLWVATARGVCRLPFEWLGGTPVRRARIPTLVEFPPPPQEPASVGWPRSLLSRDGLLWFATDHGVVNFNPADLQRSVPASPVRLESIRANGEIVSGLHAAPPGLLQSFHPLRLPSGLRDLEIKFTAPSLSFPERTRFRHKLVGFDPEWQDATLTRRARYGRIPAGDYTFLVAASDAEGAWNGPETELAFVVPAPLWRNPWILSCLILALIAGAAGLARVVSHRRLRAQLARLEQQRAMERERARIAQDMHDELGAKLTKISFLSERARNDLAEPARTSAKLNSIAVTSRELLHSLDEIVWAVNPRNDTLEHLADYLGQYAAEYLHQTSVEFDLRIPRALPARALSAEVRHNLFLAFKEALGNALKHSGATRVRVEMALNDDEFSIQVNDNGRGLDGVPLVGRASSRAGLAPTASPERSDPSPGTRRQGMGLSGMRDRLAQAGGHCEIRSTPETGTTITLNIPLPSTERNEA